MAATGSLSMDRDKMSIHYRGPSIDASYQISVHLGKRFQRRRYFRNQPIKNKNLYRGPSIDASLIPKAMGMFLLNVRKC
jgi:hypothetical protein